MDRTLLSRTAMFHRATLLAIWILPIAPALVACGRQAREYTRVEPQGEFLDMEVPSGSMMEVHFYTYESAGRNVNFFVRKDRDGTVRTHFDACYSCFKYKMGYVHEGDEVVCRACRIGYDLREPIWDFVGPCVPITLSSKVLGRKVRIRKRDLEKGAQFF